MRKTLSIIICSVLTVGLMAGCSTEGKGGSDKQVTLNAIFMKQAGYSEEDITSITQEFMKENPNIKVEASFVPYEALEQKIITSAPNGGNDVVLIDAPWTAKLAKSGMIKEVSDKLPDSDRKEIFAGALSAVEYDRKLYGMPWLNDTKYLFYNKDMLKQAGFNEPPKTWDELAQQATVIKEKQIAEFPIVWSWKQAEALVCDITSLTEVFGGGFVRDGKVDVDSAANKQAIQFMVDSVKSGISNPKSTEFLEEDVRGVFSSGKAAFALNWTYMFNMSNNDAKESQVTGKVGIAASPGNGQIKSASVNGGMGLAITKGSKNPDESWKYIQYLSSKVTQKKYAKNALPIWKSLLDDKDVIATNPDVVTASKVQYDYLVNRPQVPWYGDFSTEIQVSVQKALLGQQTVDDTIKSISSKAKELSAK